MSSEKVTVADLDLNDEHMTIGLSDTLKEAAKRLLSIMQELKSQYGFKSFQFRDPVFGLKKGFIEEFCLAIIKSGFHALT